MAAEVKSPVRSDFYREWRYAFEKAKDSHIKLRGVAKGYVARRTRVELVCASEFFDCCRNSPKYPKYMPTPITLPLPHVVPSYTFRPPC
jgi:hypothetical protein